MNALCFPSCTTGFSEVVMKLILALAGQSGKRTDLQTFCMEGMGSPPSNARLSREYWTEPSQLLAIVERKFACGD